MIWLIEKQKNYKRRITQTNYYKFEKRKVYSPFRDNIWGTGLADIQLISKFDKLFRFLLSVFEIYSKYARVIPLKDKNGITINNDFQKVLNDYKWKPHKIWLKKGSEIYNRSMKLFLQNNDIEMY